MNSLLASLKKDFPDFTFQEDDQFAWSPEQKAVHYDPKDPEAQALLLHELSHGILGHTDYQEDIRLVAMEAAAWEKAESLAKIYKVTVSEAVIDDNLDTYRDWLHARSTCPACTATGFQKASRHYACPACTKEWRVNEARLCALRRYSL